MQNRFNFFHWVCIYQKMFCIPFLVRFNIQSITLKRCFAFLFTFIWNLNFTAFCWSKIDFESIKLHVNKFLHQHPRLCLTKFIYLPFYIIANWFYGSRFWIFLSGCLALFFHLISERGMHYKPNYSTTVTNVYWTFFLVEIVGKYESERKTNRGL